MQIFEFHFNPKSKEDKFFDSFIYEPEQDYEKELGSLYIVGELENALPSNSKLLDNIAQVIKRNYYRFFLKSPEKALSEALKRANDFLADEVKKENVSWLGNLNFIVLSLGKQSSPTGTLPMIFTKTGDLKLLLIRGGKIIDVGKNLDYQEIEPYPLKIFFSVVSGKLAQNDIILVLTKDIFNFFVQENLLDKISQAKELNKKTLGEILPAHLFSKGQGAKTSGVCFLAVLKEKAEEKETIFPEKERLLLPLSRLSRAKQKLIQPFQEISQKIKKFSPRFYIKKGREAILRFFSLPNTVFQKIIPVKKEPEKTKPEKTKEDTGPGLKAPTPLLIKSSPNFFQKLKLKGTKNKLILIFALVIFLSLGFLIFKEIGQRKEEEIKIPLNRIQEKVNLAENFLIFKNEEKANSLFREAWSEILLLAEKKTSSNIIDLKQSIEDKLKNLNKLEEIENPEIVSDFDLNLFSLPPKPDVAPPSFEFNFDLYSTYLSNLYFLDKKNCQIIKYPYLEKEKWGLPVIWKKTDENCFEPKSMAIDSSIWILNKDNSIVCYHKGEYQETVTLDTFPFVENITEIETKFNLPYLYLLEPINKRIIIIDKDSKEIVRQFQSEKFDNLKSLAISNDGKTIWLLNDLKVYQIEFDY